MNKSGQITIFIIVAIVLVAGVAGYFMFRNGLFQGNIPSTFEPVYTSFLSCVEDKVYTGIDLLESQAGYIEMPEFESGSDYMPFSSQLNLLGNPIPYWYYVSGNNIEREQVPSKRNLEIQLEDFLEERISNCRFDDYSEQGFVVQKGTSDARVTIDNSDVKINLNMDLNIIKEEDSVIIRNHKLTINSNLGNLYNSARKVYDAEQDDLFLERYALDTLNLYAPVEGVELTCAPKIWIAEEVFKELQEAIEINTLVLTNKGDDKDYFKVDLDVKEDVRFMNSRNWSYSFEVNPTEGNFLMATPVGNQPGLGILGFCYVPYHFVYEMKYPVLVQISDGEETFQFPMAVVVRGNNPRESLDAVASDAGLSELCMNKNTLMQVNTYDSNLNRVDAEISFECFGTKCNIGETSGGSLSEEFPQCVNGYVLARAEGFNDAKFLYSTTASGNIEIILDRLYEKNIDLKLDGTLTAKTAIVNFVSDKGSKSIAYPSQRTVELVEGEYEISVQIYDSSELNIGATTTQQCVEIPQTGLLGIFGGTKEKCYDIEMPEQIISNALAGGGTQSYYILESDLQNSGAIEINVQSLPKPSTLEQLQNNYYLFEQNGLGVNF